MTLQFPRLQVPGYLVAFMNDGELKRPLALAIQTIEDPNLKLVVQNVFLIITWITLGFIGGYTQWFIVMFGD